MKTVVCILVALFALIAASVCNLVSLINLETRVTQLETALKAQALINEARSQLRENP